MPQKLIESGEMELCPLCEDQSKKSRNGKPHEHLLEVEEPRLFKGSYPKGFEEQDYQEWLAENPDGTRKQYACEVASLTAEVVDEVLQDKPEFMRPEQETLLGYMRDCE